MNEEYPSHSIYWRCGKTPTPYDDYYKPMYFILDTYRKTGFPTKPNTPKIIGKFSYTLQQPEKPTYSHFRTFLRKPKYGLKWEATVSRIKVVALKAGKMVMTLDAFANPEYDPLYYVTVNNHPEFPEYWKIHVLCWDTGECIVVGGVKDPKSKKVNLVIPHFDKDFLIRKLIKPRLKKRKNLIKKEIDSTFAKMLTKMQALKTLEINIQDIADGKIDDVTVMVAKKMLETF